MAVLRGPKRFGSALVAAALVLLGGIRHFAFPSAPPVQFLTVPARVEALEQTVLASGTIQPSKLVSVGAQASGRILALHVALGDPVTKGQLIAEIDPSTERNALEIAEATLQQERASRESRGIALKQAELAFKRAGLTYTQDASSQADFETAAATYQEAKSDVTGLDAQIRQATLQVDTARVTLAYTNVVAPMDGTVVAIVAPEGQTVNAVQAAPTIVKLANLDVMTVKAQISEADITKVHAGQKVYFTILGAPEHRYYTTLRAVEPAPESIAAESGGPGAGAQSSNSNSAIYYNGLFEICDPAHELRISMTAQVNVVLGESANAVSIPSAALGPREKDGRYTVSMLGPDGKPLERRISVGINNNVSAEVLSGLKAGERVIVAQGLDPADEKRRSTRLF